MNAILITKHIPDELLDLSMHSGTTLNAAICNRSFTDRTTVVAIGGYWYFPPIGGELRITGVELDS